MEASLSKDERQHLAAALEPQSVRHQARLLLVRRCSRTVMLGFLLLIPQQGLAALRGLEAAKSLDYRAMKSHLGLLAIIRSFSNPSVIKGIASTEEEAYSRILQNNPGMLICSDQQVEGYGFSLCRRATQAVIDLRVLMVLTQADADTGRALEKMVESPQALTQREKGVLILMLKGATDREIAGHLLISIHTVKEYGKSIRRKYQVKTRLQLISTLLERRRAPAASVPTAR